MDLFFLSFLPLPSLLSFLPSFCIYLAPTMYQMLCYAQDSVQNEKYYSLPPGVTDLWENRC